MTNEEAAARLEAKVGRRQKIGDSYKETAPDVAEQYFKDAEVFRAGAAALRKVEEYEAAGRDSFIMRAKDLEVQLAKAADDISASLRRDQRLRLEGAIEALEEVGNRSGESVQATKIVYRWASRYRARRAELGPEPDQSVSADLSADRAWIDGANFGWNCGKTGDHDALRVAVAARTTQIKEAKSDTATASAKLAELEKEGV